jgi:hypothetical protein
MIPKGISPRMKGLKFEAANPIACRTGLLIILLYRALFLCHKDRTYLQANVKTCIALLILQFLLHYCVTVYLLARIAVQSTV